MLPIFRPNISAGATMATTQQPPAAVRQRIKPNELTIRGLILGALITTVFTAANIYLGLKVGLTFASSIPAAVISMAILSAVKDSSILENNIVQTVASAGVTLAAHTTTIWRTQVRFLGAGVIAVAAIYTLARLAKPVVGGLVSTLAASKARATGAEPDRDLEPQWIYVLTAACLVI